MKMKCGAAAMSEGEAARRGWDAIAFRSFCSSRKKIAPAKWWMDSIFQVLGKKRKSFSFKIFIFFV